MSPMAPKKQTHQNRRMNPPDFITLLILIAAILISVNPIEP